tara:strand:- start:211 stop:1380 length:1170 start_codon:yes stop_codon:yes gene_type:complete
MKKNKFLKIVTALTFAFIIFACQAGKDNRGYYENHTSDSSHSTEKHDDSQHNEHHKEEPIVKETKTEDPIVEETKTEEPIVEKDVSYEQFLSSIDNILDPSNVSWPRTIIINETEIIISEKPERLATISLGHDEILFGITDSSQIVATTSFAQEEGSNIQSKSKGLPTISSDPETIIAQDPDIVFADPFASPELIDALEDFGITVIQTQLNNSIDGRKNDVWLMSYITGNLAKAKSLVEKIDNNIESLNNLVMDLKDPKMKVITLSWWDAYWTAGSGSTEDSIIQLAGGTNLSAENDVVSNSTIDKELLISMNPEIILINQSVQWGGQDFYDDLLADDSLSSIQAIKNDKVYMVNPNWWGTLSYWNIKGSEELAKILFNVEQIEGFGDF